MLLPLSHMCGVRLMFSYSFFLSFFVVYLFFCLYLLLSFFFLLCYLLFIFLVIQSDLEGILKICQTIFHCKHILTVKYYAKLGILYAEKFGGFYIKKVHPFLIRMDYVLIEK